MWGGMYARATGARAGEPRAHIHEPCMSASHDLLFDCSVSTKCARAPGVIVPGVAGPAEGAMRASGAWGCAASESASAC